MALQNSLPLTRRWNIDGWNKGEGEEGSRRLN